MGCNSKSPPESAESLLESRAGWQAQSRVDTFSAQHCAAASCRAHLLTCPATQPRAALPLSPRRLNGDSPRPLCLTPGLLCRSHPPLTRSTSSWQAFGTAGGERGSTSSKDRTNPSSQLFSNARLNLFLGRSQKLLQMCFDLVYPQLPQ